MKLSVFDLRYNHFFQQFFLFLGLSKKFPSTLNIEMTNHCNLACVFCPRTMTNRKLGNIEPALFKKIVNEMALKRKKLWILWLMKDGESLLHPNLVDLIFYAKKKNITRRIEIYTNGILLEGELAKNLINSGLDSLIVSLDAVDLETFKKIKGHDAYEKIKENVLNFMRLKRNLKVRKPILSVKMIDDGQNQAEIEKFKKFWQGKVDGVVIQKLHSWEGSVKIPNSKLQISNLRRYPCNLPWLAPAITWDGKVMPCCVNYNENEMIMGDLTKESLEKIWQGKKYKNLREAHLRQDFFQFPTCARCFYWQQLPNMSFWLRRLGV